MRKILLFNIFIVLGMGAIGVYLTTIYTAYKGSEKCQSCHPKIYNAFMKTGHAHIVHKVEKGTPPKMPFSSVPAPPEGYAWEDISYVLGGYGWKARFLDRKGYLITGEKAQYNLATKEWVAYYPEQRAGTKRYDCAECHTTGWRTLDESGGVHQDALEGIAGIWTAPGIQCERCHGEGEAHMASEGDKGKIVKNTSAELCGQCHYLDGRPRIEAQGGLIRSDQYDELRNSPHGMLTCVVCHDPHRSTRYHLGGMKTPTCTTCHTDQAVRLPEMADLSCISCHMPLAAKSAVATGPGGILGDMHSHMVKLNTDPDARMFSEDGKFVLSDGAGRAILKVEFACRSCHNGEIARKRSVEWMYKNAGRIH